MELNVEQIRGDFPILKTKVNGNNLIYFDNAATSARPIGVIEGEKYFYENLNANPLRSIHTLAEKATLAYDEAREKIAAFINASPEEIVFVKNATEAINLASFAFQFKKGDRVATTYLEHHSNLLPWLALKDRKGVQVDIVDVDDNYELDIGYYENLKNGTKLVAVSHESNVTGTINDVKKIADLVHKKGAVCLVDAAQSFPHMKIDVKDLDIDFLALSAHKALGPMGLGVLYIKKDMVNNMRPFMTGGEMIKSVKLDKIDYADMPALFEAGTQNISGAYAFGIAVDYLNRIGMDRIARYEKGLTDKLFRAVSELKDVTVYGGKSRNFGSIMSFGVKGLHPHDVAYLLDRKGIAIRSGFHCAQPFIEDKLKLHGTARASLYFYNTKEEIDKFVAELGRLSKI